MLPKVEVLAGRDKGKQGVVTVIAKRRNSVMVEGMYTVSETQSIGECSCN